MSKSFNKEKIWNYVKIRFKEMNPWVAIPIVVFFLAATAFWLDRVFEKEERIVETPKGHTLDGGRLVADNATIYKRQSQKLQQTVKELRRVQNEMLSSLAQLTEQAKNQVQHQQATEAIENAQQQTAATQAPPATSQVPPGAGGAV